MALLKKIQEKTKASGGDQKFNAFGVVFQVETAVEAEDKSLKLTGKVLNKNPQLKDGETVSVIFRGDNAVKSVTNFIKGNGKGALKTADAAKGSFLTLEGCYISDEMDGDNRVLSSRWLNTLASSRNSDHDNRSFIENVLATAPRISFKNPEVKAGEPENITLPVNAKTFSARVKNEHGTFAKDFPIEWAIEKLNAVKANDKLSVVIDTIEPNEAVVIAGSAGLEETLTAQLSRGTKALAMLRVSDGDDVITRAVYVGFKKEGDEYVPDVTKALEDLFKNNIFKGVPNEDLFKGMADGSIKVESIPGYRMVYAGDPWKDDNAAFKLVADVKEGKTQRYQMIFGTDGNRFAKVILPGIARNDHIDGFSPFNILADEPGTYLANEFSTPHIAPKAAAQPPVQPEEATGPAPDFSALEHEFDKSVAEEDEPSAGPRP